MVNKYIIKWTSKITDYSGQGTHAFTNIKTINDYIIKLNIKYKNIIHHYKIIAPENTPILDINNI